MDIAQKLLVLADAAGPDGGQELARVLRGILGELAPYDAGEAVLPVDGRLLRWRLDDHEGELLGGDLVRHVGTLHAPIRLDDLDDVSPFPETRRGMEALGLRSLLVLPFQGGGALALARRYGWAFVGASLHHLWPVRGMTGIALRLAVLLTGLERRVETLEGELERATATPDELRARLEKTQSELRECLAQRAAANAGWEATRAELRQTARALAAAETAAGAARAGEEAAEARAAEADRRVVEEASRREAAEAEEQRRQAAADERLGRVEGERHALAVEVEAIRRQGENARGREQDSEQVRASLRAALGEQEARALALGARVAELEAVLADGVRARDDARAEAERGRSAAEALGSRLAMEIPALQAERQALQQELQATREEAARHLRSARWAQSRLGKERERHPEKRRRPAPNPRRKRPRPGR